MAILVWTAAALCGAVAFAAYRSWHLHWGATREEVAAPLPGDDLIDRAPFSATRAVTIDAPPAAVWPWIVQIGFGRAGFYSYDLLDNLGRKSADRIIPEFQHIAVGDLAAPMASPATERNSFRVSSFDPDRSLVWAKSGSTWVWALQPLGDGESTRLVTRLKESYAMPSGLFTIPLMEVADFPMMRKELIGIKRRAEAEGKR